MGPAVGHALALRAANLKTAGNKTPACSLLVSMDLLPPSEYGTESIRQSSPAGPLMRQPRDAEYTEYVQGRLPWCARTFVVTMRESFAVRTCG